MTEELAAALKQHRQSLTRSRLAVFEALLDKEPQTMQQVVAACRGRADRASVYRTIALFERLNIVQRLPIGWKYKLELSDRFHRHHHHLTCINCGRTFALAEDPLLESRLAALAQAQNFAMQGHQLEIQGLCHDCLIREKSSTVSALAEREFISRGAMRKTVGLSH